MSKWCLQRDKRRVIPISRMLLADNLGKSPIYSYFRHFFRYHRAAPWKFFNYNYKWANIWVNAGTVRILYRHTHDTHTTASKFVVYPFFASSPNRRRNLSSALDIMLAVYEFRSLYFRIKYERPTRIFSPVSSELEKILIRACAQCTVDNRIF